jgi:hypothetical protein
VLTALASILVMAFAFNSKELMYYLVGMMPLLAIVRGVGLPGRVARNLLIAALPVAYGASFIAHALTHISPEYAAHAGGNDIVPWVVNLVSQALGLSPNYMFLWHLEGPFQGLNTTARVGFIAAAFIGVAGLIWAIRRHGARRIVVMVKRRRWALLIRRAGSGLYLGATLLIVLLVSARSRGAAVYYLPIAYWAGITLLFVAIRWVSRWLPEWRLGTVGLAMVFVVPSVISYASLLVEGTSFARLSAAATRITDAGTVLRETLADREVSEVRWRMLSLPETAFYVVRGDAVTYQPSDEIWPWLVRDPTAHPTVTAVLDGDLDDIRATVARNRAAGTVVLVMSDDYEVLLVGHEGQILWDRDRPNGASPPDIK